MRATIKWIREYVVMPHRELGRPGPVCPFVMPALRLQCVWISVVEDVVSDIVCVCSVLNHFMTLYNTTEQTAGSDSKLRTFIVVFPAIGGSGSSELMKRVHTAMKPSVVEQGLMLGEFYPCNTSPGVRNPSFFPLRSPVPLFVLRHMVPGDLVFLTKPTDPPAWRVQFIRQYMKTCENELSSDLWRDAHRALTVAEAESTTWTTG